MKLRPCLDSLHTLRDQNNYIRAIIYRDSCWYAIAPLGHPTEYAVEKQFTSKRAAVKWATEANRA